MIAHTHPEMPEPAEVDVIDEDEPAYPIFSSYAQRQEVLSRLPEVDTRPKPSDGDS